MTERPILFSGPMVRALLDGRKTQTRRAIKPQPDSVKDFGKLVPYRRAKPPREMPSATYEKPVPCPYGVPGDRLWVRETWRSGQLTDPFRPGDMLAHPVWYEADGPAPKAMDGKTRVAIHMPRWASSLTLEITDVRVERLQDISEADACAEGARAVFGEPFDPNSSLTDRRRFELLWDHINGVGSWDANPWVWALSFNVLGTSRP